MNARTARPRKGTGLWIVFLLAFPGLGVIFPLSSVLAVLPEVPSSPGETYAIRLDAPQKLKVLRSIDQDFSFIVMGHVRSNEFLQIHHPFYLAMQAAARLNPDFLVFTGDFTYGDAHALKTRPPYWSLSRLADEWNLFRRFVDGFKIPYFLVPGNHELQSGAEAETLYQTLFGPTSGSFKLNRFNFVFLNTASAGTKEFTGLTDAQSNFLKPFQAEGDRTFLFVHHRIWDKGLYGSAAVDDTAIRYTLAGNYNQFEWRQDGSALKIASGLESYTDDWVRDTKAFFGKKFETITFVRVVVQGDTVTLYKAVVDPETGNHRSEPIPALNP